jgi:hypothetical protein
MRGNGSMTAQVLISHSEATAEIASQVLQALQAMIPGARIACSSFGGTAQALRGGAALPGREPSGAEDTLAALKAELAAADTVIALITGDALTAPELPFQIGAAWALGKRLTLLLSPEERSVELYLPMGHAESVVLGPEALMELARSLAGSVGLQADVGPAAYLLLSELFPGWEGPSRDSSERPIPTFNGATPAPRNEDSMTSTGPVPRSEGSTPPPRGDDTQQMWLIDQAERTEPSAAPRPDLPSASSALRAGSAISDRAWSQQDGGRSEPIDAAFGSFLQTLGSDWNALSRLDDVDVWLEAADNVLDALGPGERHVRGWYDVGYQATLLLNLARRQLELEAPDEGLEARWLGAWALLRDAAGSAGLAPAALEELHAMLENLRGPARDYTNLGRAQARVAELADLAG